MVSEPFESSAAVMAEAREQSQGLNDLMKQLLDGFNSLKAGQAETQAALRGIQESTDAVEARIVEAAKPAPPPPPAATGPGAVPITSAPSSSSAMGIAPSPIHTASPSSTNSTSLLGMPAIPLSANSMIDPGMDPFDQAIRLCKQMLSLLSGPVVKPEDSGVDQELADGSDNSSSSPVGAMPANCSTVGFSPNVGDTELGISSLQPEDSGVDEERADSSDSTNSTPDGTVPAKCSTLGFSPNVGGAELRLWPVQPEASDDDQEVAAGCDNAINVSRVEAMDSYRQSGVVSMVSPGPVGAPPPPAMQQFGILKPDKHTPTTYSTVVLNMSSDATRAKGDMKTMQASLVYTPTAVPVSPATRPPQAPDQPRLLLDSPPPWPPWEVSSMFCTTGMLPVPSRPPDPNWKTTMPLWSFPSEWEQRQVLRLLPLLARGQADCLGRVEAALLRTLTPLPEHVLKPALQGDMATDTWRYPACGLVVAISDRGAHPLVLPGYNIRAGHRAGVLKDGLMSILQIVESSPGSPTLQGASMMMMMWKSFICTRAELNSVLSLGFICKFNMVDFVDKLLKLEWVREVQAAKVQFECLNLLHYHVLAASTGAHEGIFFWLIVDMIIEHDIRFKVQYIGAFASNEIQYSSCTSQACRIGNGQFLPCDLEKVADSHNRELYQEMVPKLIAGQSTSSTVKPIGVQGARQLHIVLLVTMQWDPGEQLILPWLYSCVCCQVNIVEWIWQQQINGAILISSVPSAQPCGKFQIPDARTMKPTVHDCGATWCTDVLLPECLASWGDSSGNLITSYISVPWDPGVCTKLWCAHEKNGFILERMSCWVLHVWMLANQTSELLCTCRTVVRQFLQKLGDWCEPKIIFPRCSSFIGIDMTAACLWIVHLTHLRAAVHSTTENMLAELGAASGICDIPLPRTSPDLVHFCGDLVLRSVSILISWDSGVISQLIREVVLPKSPQLALRDIQSTPCDCLGHRQCTWAPYENTLGTHLEAHHNYNACIFLGETWLAGVMCKTKDLGLMLEGTIIQELIPQIARKTVLGEYAQYKTVEQQRELLIALRDHNDQVACVDRTSLSLPWDPDVQQLWDPGGFTSTLGLGASRNLRRGDCHGLYPQDGPWWRGLASRPKSAWIATTKGNKLHQEEGEQYRRMNSAFPDPLRLPPEPPCISGSCQKIASIYSRIPVSLSNPPSWLISVTGS